MQLGRECQVLAASALNVPIQFRLNPDDPVRTEAVCLVWGVQDLHWRLMRQYYPVGTYGMFPTGIAL